MFHKWKLVKSVVGDRILYKFSFQADEETVVDTLGFEVENGDELSALIELCEHARHANHPLLEASSFDLQNADVLAPAGTKTTTTKQND